MHPLARLSLFTSGATLCFLVLIQVVKTYSTHATFDASSDGTYHVTVVAYNRALDGSEPVCSDGVLIDTSKPNIINIIVEGIQMEEVLLSDPNGDDIWLLKNGFRVYVNNPTDICR